jgi:hypothetical protein
MLSEKCLHSLQPACLVTSVQWSSGGETLLLSVCHPLEAAAMTSIFNVGGQRIGVQVIPQTQAAGGSGSKFCATYPASAPARVEKKVRGKCVLQQCLHKLCIYVVRFN